MAVLGCGVDTNILFTQKSYFISFKENKIKYLPSLDKKYTDSIMIELSRQSRMTHDDAYSILNQLCGIISFSWDCMFELIPGHSSSIPAGQVNWEKLEIGVLNHRKFSAFEKKDSFDFIEPFCNEQQLHLAQLFSMAKSANPIYARILFYWHCLHYDHNNEKQTQKYINTLIESNDFQYDDFTESIKQNSNKLLLKDKSKDIGIGEYIYTCIRNAIAHIERRSNAEGRNLQPTSLTEFIHMRNISDLLHKLSRQKIRTYLANSKSQTTYFSKLNSDNL
ncbi:hypothetical protein L3V86_02290 [Thiotrichales bacterium 19S11-10]|nr:hypothetical protein [Thiotrichales bacterium 19S11-10]